MATPFYGWTLPVVGADADTWGQLLNDIFDDQDTQLASPANTIKGNNTGSTAASINLTPAQVQAMLPAVAGASQGAGGTKGAVPAPAAATQNYPLTGGGDYKRYVGRAFGTIITTTSVNGSQPTLAGSFNVASVSTVTTVGSLAFVTLTFTDPIPDVNYGVFVQTISASVPTYYQTKTTTTVVVGWNGNPGEISVSGF